MIYDLAFAVKGPAKYMKYGRCFTILCAFLGKYTEKFSLMSGYCS